MVVINKAGGAGGEGFLDIKNSKGTPTSSSSRCQTCSPRRWQPAFPFVEGHDAGVDAGARRVRALGQCRLALQDGRRPGDAIKTAPPASSRWAARAPSRKTRSSPSPSSRRPAQDHLRALQGRRRGRRPARRQAHRQTVNNPIEAVAQWRAGSLRPLCVFDSKPLAGKEKIAGDMSWSSIPTCKSSGSRHRVPDAARRIHAGEPPKDAVDFYVELFKKVRATPEWEQLMATVPSTRPS